MPRKSKQARGTRSNHNHNAGMVSSAAGTDKRSEHPSPGWGPTQLGNGSYFFLVICVIAQTATLMITWSTWQIRDSLPPNLPWIDSTPQLPCGILLVVSLAFVLVSPRRFGMLTHVLILAMAIAMDQFRCQPQILGVTFLMAACVWPAAKRICVWFLIAMWLWAGFHKLISPDWMGYVSFRLISRMRVDPGQIYLLVAVLVAISETGLGVLAIVRPKLGAIGCVMLHFGIAIYLVTVGWNASVLPWNICTAIVGSWLLWNTAQPETGLNSKRLALPKLMWERIAVAGLLIIPATYYFGGVRHCFAHVLYSENLPMGLITYRDRIEELESWEELWAPFPHAPKAYLDYFKCTAAVGEKLHVRDRRPGFQDRFFITEKTGEPREITLDEFFSTRNGAVAGVAADSPRDVFKLEMGGATMKKRSLDEMIYAVQFDPGEFTPESIPLLAGLPNLEQIQLADCNVSDNDLEPIGELVKLIGIGLNRTSITDAGLEWLKDLPNLSIIEHEGTVITEQAVQGLRSEK